MSGALRASYTRLHGLPTNVSGSRAGVKLVLPASPCVCWCRRCVWVAVVWPDQRWWQQGLCRPPTRDPAGGPRAASQCKWARLCSR